MKPFLPSRREFIRDSSMAASLLLFLGTGGCESLLDQIKNRPVRKMINPSNPESMNDLAIYKDAIAQMKSRVGSDPRSWWAQAHIHGNIPDPPVCNNASDYDFRLCQHGQWFFLPWHRAYLGYFEQICRNLTGEEKFGLPYWNWAIDRSVPSVFWGDSSNRLFEACRGIGPSDTLDPDIFSHQRLESILNEPNFLIFGSGYPDTRVPNGRGPLESDHGSVHVFVNGFMGAGGSALDPIFYTHHCMIDYVWYEWNVNRGHDNPSEDEWFSQKWTGHFVDGAGNPVDAQSGLTVLWPLFSYQYEPSQIGTTSASEALTKKSEKDLQELKRRLEKGAKVALKIKTKIPLSQGENFFSGRSATLETPTNVSEFMNLVKDESINRVLVNIGFADYPRDRNFFVRVFVNNPKADINTSIEDEHYAGSFSFFGVPMGRGSEHMHKPLYLVDLTPTLVRMRKSGSLNEGEKLTLQLVTKPFGSRNVQGEMLTLEDLSLIVSEADVVQKK